MVTLPRACTGPEIFGTNYLDKFFHVKYSKYLFFMHRVGFCHYQRNQNDINNVVYLKSIEQNKK